MPIIAIVFGILLAVVGISGFVVTGMTHLNALIPFVLGDLLVMLGVLTLVRPKWRKHTMHAAATLALLGVGGSAGGTIQLLRWLVGTAPEHPIVVMAQSATSLLCAIFVAFAIRSFIEARRAREGASAT